MIQIGAYEIQIRRPLSGWTAPDNNDNSDACFVPLSSFADSRISFLTGTIPSSLPSLESIVAAVENVLPKRSAPATRYVWAAWSCAANGTSVVASAPSASKANDPEESWEYAEAAQQPFVRHPDSPLRMWLRRRWWHSSCALQINALTAAEETAIAKASTASPWVTSVVSADAREGSRQPTYLPTSGTATAATSQLSGSERAAAHTHVHIVPQPVLLAERGPSRSGTATPRLSRSGTNTPRSRASSVGASGRSIVPVDHWMKDQDTRQCLHCGKEFGLVTRRHHCRLCGLVFCSKCCRSEPRFGGVRVCVDCIIEDERWKANVAAVEAEHAVQLDALNQSLLLAGGVAAPEDGDAGAATERSLEPTGSNPLVVLLLKLEADTRKVIEDDMLAGFQFLTRLGKEEIAALAEIAEVHNLPCLIQLEGSISSLQVANAIAASGAAPVELSVASPAAAVAPPSATVCARAVASPVPVIAPPQPTPPLISVDPPPTAAAQGQLLSLHFVEFSGVPGYESKLGRRADVAIDNRPPIAGDWTFDETLHVCVVVPSASSRITVSFLKRSGNPLTELVLKMTSTVGTASFTVEELLRASAATGEQGNVVCWPLKLSAGTAVVASASRSVAPSLVKMTWTITTRDLFRGIPFCPECGCMSTRCSCGQPPPRGMCDDVGQVPRLPQDLPVPRLMCELPGLPSEANAVREAVNALITCGAIRLLMEKSDTVHVMEAEECEAYGKLRSQYFRDTNRAVRKEARRPAYSAIEERLRVLFQEAHLRVAADCLRRWHTLTVAHERERKQRLARLQLEKRLATLLDDPTLVNGHEVVAMTGSSAPAALPSPSPRIKPRRRTSEKCCSLQ